MYDKIYLDMDNVCVNFQKHILHWLILDEDYKANRWDIFSEVFDSSIVEREKAKYFRSMSRKDWAGLEPSDLFFPLLQWSYDNAKDVIFLTAAPKYNASECAIGKTKWIRKWAGSNTIIITEDKARYSEPNTILIDDNIENCLIFNKGPGKAYLWEQDYNQKTSLEYFNKELLSEQKTQ